MFEVLFELCSSAVDFIMILYFYANFIGEKWNWKKGMVQALIITSIQFTKEMFLEFGDIALFIDTIIICAFLFLCSEKKNFKNFVSAVIMDTVFASSVMIFASTAISIGVNVEATLSFGFSRILYTIVLKVFTLACYLALQKPMRNLYNSLNNQVDSFFVMIITMISITLAYAIGLVKGNQTVLYLAIFLLVLSISILYFMYRYGTLLKKQAEIDAIHREMEIAAEYVEKLEVEHTKVRRMRHDLKKQLSVVQLLLEDKNYKEALENLNNLNKELEVNKVSISNNIYVDAVLRQKIAEYANIHFDIDIVLSKDFKMEGTHIVSLLSNIIDNACEELARIQKTSFQLVVKGNAKQLFIQESNECSNNTGFVSSKDQKNHGFGLKIIHEIVNTYKGDVEIKKENGMFELSICILF